MKERQTRLRRGARRSSACVLPKPTIGSCSGPAVCDRDWIARSVDDAACRFCSRNARRCPARAVTGSTETRQVRTAPTDPVRDDNDDDDAPSPSRDADGAARVWRRLRAGGSSAATARPRGAPRGPTARTRQHRRRHARGAHGARVAGARRQGQATTTSHVRRARVGLLRARLRPKG